MSSEWREVKLGDVVEIIMGQSPKSEFYNDRGEGLPFLQGNRTFGLRYPTFDTYCTDNKRTANKGDVIMSVRAPVGDLNFAQTTISIGRGVCALNFNNNNNNYLYYLLKNNVKGLLNRESGTVFGSVNKKDILGLKVMITENEFEQKTIAKILSSLDEKIELNNQINKTLEEIAQTIFKHWFIDFEPFGNIMPDNWNILTLEEVSILSAGGDKPKNYSQNKTNRCQVPIYSNGISNGGLYGYTDAAKIFDESVTVSARGTIGYISLRDEPFMPIVRLITLVPKTNYISAKYLYFALKHMNILGTGTTQQQLTVPAFKSSTIIVPTLQIIEEYTNIVNPMFNLINANKIENEKLSQLRDTLLPKLMSGEIRVPFKEEEIS